jgi:hypothetical protein
LSGIRNRVLSVQAGKDHVLDRAASVMCISYSHDYAKFKHICAGHFFRKVACTKYQVHTSFEESKFSNAFVSHVHTSAVLLTMITGSYTIDLVWSQIEKSAYQFL